jgi:hypothetical protein
MQLTHSIGPKTHVLVRFGPFRYYTNVDAKLAELVPLTHKFNKQSRVLGRFRPFDYCIKVDAKLAELDGTRWDLLPIFR